MRIDIASARYRLEYIVSTRMNICSVCNIVIEHQFIQSAAYNPLTSHTAQTVEPQSRAFPILTVDI